MINTTRDIWKMCPQIALSSAARAILAHFQISLVVLIINCTPSRVITYTNLDLNKSRQKFHHSLKEHHKISNIPKFRCEML
jgi:hypothetical protein